MIIINCWNCHSVQLNSSFNSMIAKWRHQFQTVTIMDFNNDFRCGLANQPSKKPFYTVHSASYCPQIKITFIFFFLHFFSCFFLFLLLKSSISSRLSAESSAFNSDGLLTNLITARSLSLSMYMYICVCGVYICSINIEWMECNTTLWQLIAAF